MTAPKKKTPGEIVTRSETSRAWKPGVKERLAKLGVEPLIMTRKHSMHGQHEAPMAVELARAAEIAAK